MAVIFLTGPVRSGKSDLAVSLATERQARGDLKGVSIAVFTDAQGDPEFQERIEHHRATRPSDWHVLECYADPFASAQAPADRILIVDCLGTAIGALMNRVGAIQSDEPEDLADSVDALVDSLLSREGETVIVSNEVGWGLVPGTPGGRRFRDLVGRANRALAARADTAHLIVAGHAIDLKAAPRHLFWPVD